MTDIRDPHSELHHDPREARRGRTATATGASLEAILGAAAVVLAILGLGGMAPATMAYVATICAGLALLLEGAALSAYLAAERAAVERQERTSLSGSVSAEFIAGATAVVLGVLALIGVEPEVLVPVAAIVMGAGLLLGGSSTASLQRVGGDQGGGAQDPSAQAPAAAGGAEVLIGIGVAVLGVLALLDIAPLSLSLVAMLALGAVFVLAGGAIGGRMAALLR